MKSEVVSFFNMIQILPATVCLLNISIFITQHFLLSYANFIEAN